MAHDVRDAVPRSVRKASRLHNSEPQFKATQMWNNIAGRFRDEMPTKRHMKQLKFYDDSFSGKEAVNFLLQNLPSMIIPSNKEITRDSCSILLQKFADSGLFRNPRLGAGEKSVFFDNATLYVWNGEAKLNGLHQTPVRLRRVNSFTGSADRSIISRPALVAPLSPEVWRHRIEIPAFPPKHIPSSNRRLSSSTGNLSLIGLDRDDKFERTLSIFPRGDGAGTIPEEPDREREHSRVDSRETRLAAGKPPTPILVRDSSPVYDVVPNAARPDADDEVYGTFRRRPTSHAHSTPAKGTRKGVLAQKSRAGDANAKGSMIARLTPSRFKSSQKEMQGKENSPPMPFTDRSSIYASIKVRPTQALSDTEQWKIYAGMLVQRVKEVLGTSESSSLITWPVSGHDVKWICQQRGNLLSHPRMTDDWSPTLRQRMKYLENFPFHTNANVVIYRDKQEVDMFLSVVDEVKQDDPILSVSFGVAFLRVLDHFKNLTASNERPGSGRGQHVSADLINRLLDSNARSEGGSNLSSRCSSKDDLRSTNSLSSQFPFVDGASWTPPQSAIRVAPKSGLKTTNFLLRTSDQETILQLPGLKHSPELLERMKNMSVAPGSDASSPLAFDDCPVEAPDSAFDGVSRDLHLPLIESLQLLLLSLPLRTRFRLHSMVRFMGGLASNHCLSLRDARDKYKRKQTSNRYVVLEEFCDFILASAPLHASPRESDSIMLSPRNRIRIVTLLVDHHGPIFKIPADFERKVIAAIQERSNERIELDGSPASAAPQYCDRIQPDSYSEQGEREAKRGLLAVLDCIATDPRLSQSERDKKLKLFRQKHPDVFALRFPQPEQSEPGRKNLLSRIFRSRND